ncbi:hypothetical protein [Nocardioides albus]|uniref:Lipoprotein n=1 Tax=Nocardioides albus TaxID=1841 RepID=A0A7W5F9E0_9ACTN|nr:hypothetical protein [Nocardioides albus]MBB3090130.1 hypothetical protein [Nocardioides albus]GGU27882.1 hypothetical protein GCM10007979_28380 [Nocardioides albus]
MPSPQSWWSRAQSWRTSLSAVALAAALAGCGQEPVTEPVEPAVDESELLVNGRVTCDQDVSSERAKDTIERVGGLQQPTWSVRFAESTAAGVVVLVTGDLEDAEPRLFDDYGVAVIVGSAESRTSADDFRAVREAVREICG